MHSFAPSWRTIIGKADQEAAPLQAWLDLLLKPYSKDLMEQAMGPYGGNGAPWHDACVRMVQYSCFHAPGPEPFPNAAPYPSSIDPLAEPFPQSSPVNTVAVSTHIGIHEPAYPLLHAPLASLMQCLVGAASWPQALRAVVAVLLVDHFQQHGHRSLDHLLLARWLPHRTLTPVVLVHPDALDGCGRIAATAEALVQVTHVLVKVCGLLLRRSPLASCRTRLARWAVCLPQQVCIDQGGQGCTHPVRIMGGLRRKALECWCDGG